MIKKEELAKLVELGKANGITIRDLNILLQRADSELELVDEVYERKVPSSVGYRVLNECKMICKKDKWRTDEQKVLDNFGSMERKIKPEQTIYKLYTKKGNEGIIYNASNGNMSYFFSF